MKEDQTTWAIEIEKARVIANDQTDTVACTLAVDELHRPFNPGFGGSEGAPFTCWSETRVYFPAVYDGSEWVSSVPRNPCDEATGHVGGE